MNTIQLIQTFYQNELRKRIRKKEHYIDTWEVEVNRPHVIDIRIVGYPLDVERKVNMRIAFNFDADEIQVQTYKYDAMTGEHREFDVYYLIFNRSEDPDRQIWVVEKPLYFIDEWFRRPR